jgi:hypothetical protein
MGLDTLVVALIVGAAVFAVGRRLWRSVRSAKQPAVRTVAGGAGCAGCDAHAASGRGADWDDVRAR